MSDRHKENSKRFQELNMLYGEYINNISKDNVENAITAIRDKMIVTTFEIFSPNYLQHVKGKDNDGLNKISNADFPDVIVKKVLDCLKSFPESNACKTGGKFSKYLYVSVKKALNVAKNVADLSNNNAGTKISENDVRLAKTVKKLDSDLEKLCIANEQRRNEKIAATLTISIEEVVFYKKMNSNTSVSLEAKKIMTPK